MDSNKPERPEDEVLTFRIKRGHFYAVLVPLAFLLGITAGYLAWGQGAAAPTAQSALSLDSGEGSPAEQTVAQATAAPQSVAEQIEALPRYNIEIDESDPVYGPEDAAITIIEFADFECPYCQRHFAQVHPQLLAEYPDQIRFVYKDFPLTSIHPNALPAAIAGQCALEQDAFWPFHDLLFSGRLGLSRSAYDAYAAELELDTEAFTACLDEERYRDVVQADASLAQNIGVSSTPTFFVNGIVIVGAQPFEAFDQVIEYELERIATEGN